MIEAFVYGVIFAFGLIIPLGAQNIFVFNQGASQKHFYQTLPVVITAGLCDTFLILLAVSGVSVLVFQFVWIKIIIYLIGLIFLSIIIRSIWQAKPHLQKAKAVSIKKQIVFALSVSLLNPHAIIDTVVIIGANALSFNGSARMAYTAACILVSFTWFVFLAFMGRTMHKLDSSGKLILAINKCSAVILVGVMLYIAYQFLLAIQSFFH